jgi:Lrp/AsnC family leucine-responsive transcriptional regulator
MRVTKLDAIDLELLDLLQVDGRVSQHDLAEAVGLSSPATGERLRKLIERGVIRSFVALLDPKRLGQDVSAFISVGIDGSRFYSEFVERARAHPEILECHAITGSGSHMLKVRTASTTTLERLLAEIQSWAGVHWTTTSVVLSVAKESAAIPLVAEPGDETVL